MNRLEDKERLDFLEFRQELLFSNSSIDRLLFEYRVTKIQYEQIMDLFDSIRERIGNGETVNHHSYENEVYKIVPQHNHDYHFAESLAQCFHENDRWDEVFVHLYGELPKFQHYLSKQD
ncbi:hypothetical protein WQ54_12630 [Bacillus sp. SA1-12]|uniref:hypothetical protein n=1 Tax=Bacillus sp. SA1-12 TaxID=1455638 RepID=UPI000626CF17|nr:hypothetical protein [Bacillus sp. SA1-12]KKI91816.1 hypothetical protein WQ54_12630 [Bacillus sp. SA1-12]